jgi:putative restriction endonuclease
MDGDEQLGQPIVSNGLPLTKIHHAAFDAHLIGIDRDYRIHVSDRLLEIHDGPFLELGLKGIVGQVIEPAAGPRGVRIFPIEIGWRSGSSN